MLVGNSVAAWRTTDYTIPGASSLLLRSCLLCLGAPLTVSQQADAIDNVFNDLSDGDAPIEPPPEWTAVGARSRSGIIITSTGNARTYTRIDFDITAEQAWQTRGS